MTNRKTDYMTREQAEYDRLVSGITDAMPEINFSHDANPVTTVKSIVESRNIPAINSISRQRAMIEPVVEQSYTPKRPTIVQYEKATSFPKTAFEQQADDFQNRLRGHTGFSDIMEALKHAEIGFFERL
ncbi:unnamed protein product [Onchocerca flexuosa]|uniref:Phage protein n=1 Tax=Onchocerca flexuosa TaxID=387005 RepID=A0A183HK64_9BILA|nr:unnamed protein product [Onchocerca flexuosa]